MAVKRRRSVNVFDTKNRPAVPPVKGRNPGPIPKSEKYQPKDRSREAADEESSAFRGIRVGDEMPPSRRNRAISDAALGGLTAAQARMRGVPLEEPDDASADEPDNEQEQDSVDEPSLTEMLDEGPTREEMAAALQEAYAKGQYDARYDLNQERETLRVQNEVARFKAAREHDTHVQQQPPLQQKNNHPATQFEPAGPARSLTPEPPFGTLVHSSGISTRLPTTVDVDSLWDWIRHDPDLGAGFLGRRLSTSIELHTLVAAIRQAESQGIAIIRSIAYQNQHLGFVMLAPILTAERTALMHIYLREDIRGQLHALIGPLIELAQVAVPSTTFAVYSADAVWARLHRKLLLPLGFTEQTMFVRTPASTSAATNQGKSATLPMP